MLFLLGYSIIATVGLVYLVKMNHVKCGLLLESNSENALLSDRYIDVVDDKITDIDINLFLNKKRLTHQWKTGSLSHIEGIDFGTQYKDTLKTESCVRCGLIRRNWVHGFGAIRYNNLAGYFRGNRKLDTMFVSEANLLCVHPGQMESHQGHTIKLLN